MGDEVSGVPELQMYEGASVDDVKDHYARLFQQGFPLILYPHLLRDVTALGFEEGVHFILSRPIPLGEPTPLPKKK